jgi:hypothetical protein
VCISRFSHLTVFLAIFHLPQCVFLIFLDFKFSLLTPGPIVCISHFSHFSVFLIFRDFQFSRHIPGPTVGISHYSRF